MRLINTRTLDVTLFTEAEVSERPYVILSHTWGPDEVTLEDMKHLTTARCKKGFAKITATTCLAEEHGFEFAWVDTCCIDKTSSAELSEAINSMFRWYQNAAVCYAFLEDLPVSPQGDTLRGLEACRWFTRGWTLQELIAPRQLHFYDSDWQPRGTKQSLVDELSAVTGIQRPILEFQKALSDISLAQRMSWASRRQTSREEDRAYSLLGIFDVNMAMLYGEGCKAFVRLQEEILKNTTDLSLLAWQTSYATDQYCGVLSSCPDDFWACGSISLEGGQFRYNDEIVATNKGLKIRAAVKYKYDGTYSMYLHCCDTSVSPYGSIGILLGRALDVYLRAKPSVIERDSLDNTVGRDEIPQILYLASTVQPRLLRDLMVTDLDSEFGIVRAIFLAIPGNRCSGPPGVMRIGDIRAVPLKYWDNDWRCFLVGDLVNFRCFVRFRITLGRSRPSANKPLPRAGIDYEITYFLLCVSLEGPRVRFSLYNEATVQALVVIADDEIINPFNDIDSYGSSGHGYSMDWLKPGGPEERGISIPNNSFFRSGYSISAVGGNVTGPSFYIRVVVQRLEPVTS